MINKKNIFFIFKRMYFSNGKYRIGFLFPSCSYIAWDLKRDL